MPFAVLVGDVLRYVSPVAAIGLTLTVVRWRSDARRRQREQLQTIGLLVAAVQNAAGEVLVLPARHVEESRRVMACRYALNNLRSALADAKEPLPRCHALVDVEHVVPRTIETMIWPMAGLARDEVDQILGLPPVADAPWRTDTAA